MKSITHISPGATLLLTAELDRWRRVKKIKLRPRDVDEMDEAVLLALTEIGFFKILETSNPPRAIPKPESVRILPLQSGNKSDGEAASRLSAQLLQISGAKLNNEMLLNDAISEAMTNAVQHAYPERTRWRYPVLSGEWWTTGSYSPGNQVLTVWVYDQGVGIPTTLPRSHMWERVRGRLVEVPLAGNILQDQARVIEAAIQEGRTSMQTSLGRGLGLAEMASLILDHGQGHLRIISGRGEFRLWGDGRPPERINHSQSLGGTLVEISLSLRH